MSSFVRCTLTAAAAATLLCGAAGAQLLGGVGVPALPPVGLPTGNVPVVGPVLDSVLAQPGAREAAVAPTLDTVTGLPQRVAESGASTLLDMRKLRLRQLIRE